MNSDYKPPSASELRELMRMWGLSRGDLATAIRRPRRQISKLVAGERKLGWGDLSLLARLYGNADIEPSNWRDQLRMEER